MKKTWLKIFALVMAVCMVSVLFAACDPTTPTDPTEPTQGTDPTTPDLSGEIDALLWLSSYPEVVDQIASAWKAKYPNIIVNITMMSGNSGKEALEPRKAADNMPDVLSCDADEWNYTTADGGYYRDISHTDAWKFQKASLQEQYTSPGGVKFGISYGMATMYIFYNKDLFAQAGVENIPTNYDEFLAACEQLKGAGITPIAWPGGFPNMLGHGFISAGTANLVFPVQGDSMFDNVLNTKYDYGTAEWKEVFQRNVDLVKKGYVNNSYMTTDNAETIRLFAEGEVAMVWNGSWAAGDFLPLGDHVDLFIPPWNKAGTETIGNVAAETGFGMGKNNKGREELADMFFNFIAYENYANFQNATGTIPTYATEDCPGTVVDPRLQVGADAINALSKNVKLGFQIFPTSVYTMMMQFAQDVLTGAKNVDDIGSILNPVQAEYIDSK